MRVIRLMDEPDWQSRLSPIEEIFFATSPSAKTLRPDERQPFKERWLGRYIARFWLGMGSLLRDVAAALPVYNDNKPTDDFTQQPPPG